MRTHIAVAASLAVVIASGCTQGPGNDPPRNAIPLSEVALHNTSDDCWIVLDGEVYDFTDFIGSHPGGAAILQGCGKDATELFETRPMGSGTPHSANARSLHPSFLIGELQ